MTDTTQDSAIELHRQRGRWFLLLGALLGGILAASAVLGMVLEIWGNHIGGGPNENAQAIAWMLGIALVIVALIVIFLLWEASYHLRVADRLDVATGENAASGPVTAAVAAWKSSALGRSQESPTPVQASEEVAAQPAVAVEQPTTDSTPVADAAVADAAVADAATPIATELILVHGEGTGTLPEAMDAVGQAHIEVAALWTESTAAQDQIHLVIRDLAAAEPKLTVAGLRIQGRRRVVLVDIDDRPGAVGEVFRRLHSAGIKVHSAHLASNTTLVVFSDDPDRVQAAL